MGGADSWHPESLCVSICTSRLPAGRACRKPATRALPHAANAATLTADWTIERMPMRSSQNQASNAQFYRTVEASGAVQEFCPEFVKRILLALAGGHLCPPENLSRAYCALGCGALYVVQVPAQETQPASSTQAPLTLTLQDALTRARANSVQFQAALTDQGIAHEDKVQARAGLLPSVNYNNEFIYTQPNGTPSGVFIANNTVHEYLSQGNVHQVIGLYQLR